MAFFSKEKIENISSPEVLPKQHTLLLVDDEEANLRSLAELLEGDYDLLLAHDGQEALNLVKNDSNPNRIHLIISDQRMPKMTGIDFLKKTIPLIPKTVRMVLTGYTDVNALLDSINEGQIYKFIIKPFEPKELKITVQRALELYELTDENIILTASNRKLAELNLTKEQLLKTLYNIHENDLKEVEQLLLDNTEKGSKEACSRGARIIHQVREKLNPITSLYFSEHAIRNKRILLAENDKKQQIIAKMALGGTGMELDIASDLEIGGELLAERDYDVICVNTDLIQLVEAAHEYNPDIYSVFMTSEGIASYLPLLKRYPIISNIISRNEDDRTFTIKNILTTVSKLLNQDLFGLEKYLNWGVEVRHHAIENSQTRTNLIEQMESYLEPLGVHRAILQKCIGVVEELLMNAIYDAPTDPNGNPLYNHLDRTEPVSLELEQQGVFRYACDGMLVGVSVEDPFGAFDFETIIEYLESSYSGQSGSLQTQKNKGGAGLGLLQIMEIADLVIWNVKSKIKTEVIALFNIDPTAPKSGKTTSFHYFSG